MDNKLYYGDNLEVLRKYIKDESIDLCYIDPPFNSKRNYNQIYNNIGKEDQAQAQAFVDTWTWDSMADKGLGEIFENDKSIYTTQSIDLILGLSNVLGKDSLLSYLVSMTLRIGEIYRVLKPTGSFYFHCDPTASHYLKLVVDAIFVSRGGDFKNEIIWKRQNAKGLAFTRYASNHDIIFFYTKSKDYKWNAQYKPHDEKYLKDFYKFTEPETGRLYRLADLTNPNKDRPNLTYEFPEGSGTVRVWRWTKERMQKAWDDGLILMPKTGKVPALKRYLDEQEGTPIDDTWIDVLPIQSQSDEALGYPTQKPEALLERIIEASSNKGDVILDAYCGCGTTIAVAQKLKRKWIGVDITYQSVSLMVKRLEDSFGAKVMDKVELNGVPKDMNSAVALANKKEDKTRKEFEKWAVLSYSNNRAAINETKGGDGGIDGVSYIIDLDEKKKHVDKKVLFSVKSNKNLTPSVVRDLYGTMERDGAAMGILITLYPMENLVKEAKKYGTYSNKLFGNDYPKIEVICVQDIFDGKKMNLPSRKASKDLLKSAVRKVGEPEVGYGKGQMGLGL